MIFFDQVSKVYSQNIIALDDITLKIQPKEFVSVVGPSGAGKSTMLKLLIAEERPTKGKIFINNEEINHMGWSYLPHLRRKIGAIFQDYRLLPSRNVFENIAFAMEAAGRLEEEIQQDVPEVLELVRLTVKANNFPYQLSGGEQQRVAIARALVNRPSIIIADEPTGNLDPLNTWDIIKLLIKINELGTTVLLATHNREIINALGKRVVTLDKGKVISDEERGKFLL